MNYVQKVTGTKLGNSRDFAALVELFEPSLDAYLRRWVRNKADREELVQDSFLAAWQRIRQLRSPEAFPSWLWSIARTRAWAWLRKQDSLEAACFDPDTCADPAGQTGQEAAPWRNLPDWNALMGQLKPDQRSAVELRYVAGLSYRDIAAVCGISESRTKSRIHEAKEVLKTRLPRLPKGSAICGHGNNTGRTIQEKIMTRIDTLKLGSGVFERLALYQQARFAQAVAQGNDFDTDLLGAIGKTSGGAEFLKLFGKTMGIQEFAGILNHVDKFTELRLVQELEQTDPAAAEHIKQHLFVFDDFIICDSPALAKVARQTDQDILCVALAGTTAEIRDRFMSALDAEKGLELQDLMKRVDATPWMVKTAQETVIMALHDLVETGRLRVIRDPADPGRVVVIS